MSDYILASSGRIFYFKTVLERILSPLQSLFYLTRVSELSFSNRERFYGHPSLSNIFLDTLYNDVDMSAPVEWVKTLLVMC